MSNKWNITTPDDVFESRIRIPRDTDLLIKITARVYDPDCDPSTVEDPFDFGAHTPSLEIFRNKFDTVPLVTLDDTKFTITRDAEGIAASVDNVLEATIDWVDDVEGNTLSLGVDYWYRVYVLDAANTPYVPQRGPVLFERF